MVVDFQGIYRFDTWTPPVFRISDTGSCPDLIIAATGAMFEIRKGEDFRAAGFPNVCFKKMILSSGFWEFLVDFFFCEFPHNFPLLQPTKKSVVVPFWCVSTKTEKRRQIRCDDCEEGSGNAVTGRDSNRILGPNSKVGNE